MMYGEKTGRGIIAQRFQRVEAGAEGKPKVVAAIGDKNQTLVDWEWNEIRIVAVGNRLVHQINGVNTMDLTDNHPEAFAKGRSRSPAPRGWTDACGIQGHHLPRIGR